MNTVVLLAAGKGSRARSTPDQPKPMTEIPIRYIPDRENPFETQPIIGYIINQIKKDSKIKNLVIALDFGREVIENYVRENFSDDFNLVFPDKTEIGDKIYQTIIGVKKYLPNNFLMLNTDICSSLDLIQLTDNHLENYKNGLLYTVATTHLNQGAKKCGLIEGIDSDGHYRFLPKGHGREQGWIDTGFVATSQEFINELERLTSENKDWRYHDARTKIFENGKGGVSIQPNRSWFDIGTPEDYQIAVEHVKKILTNQL